MMRSATEKVLLLAFSVSTAGYAGRVKLVSFPKRKSSHLGQSNALVKARGRPTLPIAEVQSNLPSQPQVLGSIKLHGIITIPSYRYFLRGFLYLELVSEGGTIPFSLNFANSYDLIAKDNAMTISCIFLSCH